MQAAYPLYYLSTPNLQLFNLNVKEYLAYGNIENDNLFWFHLFHAMNFVERRQGFYDCSSVINWDTSFNFRGLRIVLKSGTFPVKPWLVFLCVLISHK